MSNPTYRSPLLVVITLAFLTLFGAQNAAAGLTFLGGGGSGLPKTSLDGTSTGSNTLCTCDVTGANCSADLTGNTFTISGIMVCKKLEDGVVPDPVTFYDNGTGVCSSSFEFSPVVSSSSEGLISLDLSVVAVKGNTNPNAGVTAMGTLNCTGTNESPNAVCPTGQDSCTLNFGGITELSSKALDTNLPMTTDLDLGQVLLVSYEMPAADGKPVTNSRMLWRLCHDRFGEFDVATCEGVKGNKLKTTADGTLIVQEVDGSYSPTSFNVKEPNDTTNGTFKLDIPCQQDFDPMNIDPGTVKIGSVMPLSETIPTTSCPGTVYTATFDRASIIFQGSDGDSPLLPDKTYNLQFQGYMTVGTDGVYIIGAPPLQTK